MKYLKIVEAGFLTTVQDSGRYGFRGFGMPLSGAIDIYSYSIGNLLVGNDPDVASLEITLTGPVIKFPARMLIAITGADMTPMINGQPVAMWRSIGVSRGDVLSFGSLVSGARSYLAVSGGIRVPVVMGSRSTYLRGSLGGFNGRRLKSDDCVAVKPDFNLFSREMVLPGSMIPEWSNEVTLNLLPGVDYREFPESSHLILVNEPFKVTNNSDRMGIRLAGLPMKHNNGADVLSYPLAPGTIQVPGDGQAVIMLSDSQTVGGYRQIANIITADLYKAGQLKPGDSIRFNIITHEEALSYLIEQTNEICSIFVKKKIQAGTGFYKTVSA
jgi:antagonist of KipI